MTEIELNDIRERHSEGHQCNGHLGDGIWYLDTDPIHCDVRRLLVVMDAQRDATMDDRR